jgi:hypothetical protein
MRVLGELAGTGVSEYGWREMLLEQGCRNRLLEQVYRNMVFWEACRNSDVGIWLAGKACRNMVCGPMVGMDRVSEYGQGKGWRNSGAEIIVPHRHLPKPYEKGEE